MLWIKRYALYGILPKEIFVVVAHIKEGLPVSTAPKKIVTQEVKEVLEEVATLYGSSMESLRGALHRLRWGYEAPQEFAPYYKPEDMDERAAAHLDENVIALASAFSVADDLAKACLGRFYRTRQVRSEAGERGMEGCYFLFRQTKESDGIGGEVALSRPKNWCLAKSVPQKRMVSCTVTAERDRGQSCTVCRDRLQELAPHR